MKKSTDRIQLRSAHSGEIALGAIPKKRSRKRRRVGRTDGEIGGWVWPHAEPVRQSHRNLSQSNCRNHQQSGGSPLIPAFDWALAIVRTSGWIFRTHYDPKMARRNRKPEEDVHVSSPTHPLLHTLVMPCVS